MIRLVHILQPDGFHAYFFMHEVECFGVLINVELKQVICSHFDFKSLKEVIEFTKSEQVVESGTKLVEIVESDSIPISSIIH